MHATHFDNSLSILFQRLALTGKKIASLTESGLASQTIAASPGTPKHGKAARGNGKRKCIRRPNDGVVADNANRVPLPLPFPMLPHPAREPDDQPHIDARRGRANRSTGEPPRPRNSAAHAARPGGSAPTIAPSNPANRR